jgi:hypothetical protein
MDLLDHLVAENVAAVEHLDSADGARAGVVGVLHLGEAALPDGLADLVRPHPRLPPRRRGLRHPSGGSARTGGRSDEEADRQGARDEAPRLAGFGLLGWFDGQGAVNFALATSAPRACGFIEPRGWVSLALVSRSGQPRNV